MTGPDVPKLPVDGSLTVRVQIVTPSTGERTRAWPLCRIERHVLSKHERCSYKSFLVLRQLLMNVVHVVKPCLTVLYEVSLCYTNLGTVWNIVGHKKDTDMTVEKLLGVQLPRRGFNFFERFFFFSRHSRLR